MTTTDRLIDWCESRRLAIDVDFMTGKIKIEKHSFKTADAALVWATEFSKNWGFKAP